MKSMQSTTIRIKRDTLEMLGSLKERIGARSFDEVIRKLLMSYRKSLIERYFGIDRGRISRFSEENRLEDREL